MSTPMASELEDEFSVFADGKSVANAEEHDVANVGEHDAADEEHDAADEEHDAADKEHDAADKEHDAADEERGEGNTVEVWCSGQGGGEEAGEKDREAAAATSPRGPRGCVAIHDRTDVKTGNTDESHFVSL